MNILIVHNFYQTPGGEDSVVYNESKLLEKNGNNVILYTRSNNEIKSFGFIQKLKLPFQTIFNRKTYRDIKRIIKSEKIDIVHVHNTLTLISPSVYYAAIKCRVPIVQTIHNFRLICPAATLYREGHVCEDCISKGLKCAIKHNCYRNSKLKTALCVYILKHYRKRKLYGKLNYICLTEFNKEKLLTLKQINPEKVFIKPNFVEQTGNTVIPYNKRKKQIVFTGRLDNLKGINLLYEAWKDIYASAPKLIVCGTGPEEEWCKKFIYENNIDNIEMLGFIKNEDVRKIIGESKALILPTQWYEGFPMTIIEAYSVGTPIIGSSIGNVGDLIIEDKSGCLIRENNTQSIVNAVLELKNLDNIDKYIYDNFTNKYTDKINYRKIKYIYEVVIENAT